MDAPPSLPAAVERLVEALGSVGTVELLLMLRDARPQRRAVGDICAALRCPDTWADLQLRRLAELDLVQGDDARGFAYRPGSAEQAAAADEFARLWREDRRAIVSRMLSPQLVRRRSRFGRP